MAPHLACIYFVIILLVARYPVAAQVVSGDSDDMWDSEHVRCRVCMAGVDLVWRRSVKARDACEKEPDGHHYCDADFVKRYKIEEFALEVCDSLAQHYQADHSDWSIDKKDGFRMKKHQSPSHEKEHEEIIKAECKKWVQERHGVDKLTNYVMSNLNSGQTAQSALPALRKRFCYTSCTVGRHRKGKPAPYVDYREDL